MGSKILMLCELRRKERKMLCKNCLINLREGHIFVIQTQFYYCVYFINWLGFVFVTVGEGGGDVSALLKLEGNGDWVLVSDLRVFCKGVRDLKF